MLFDGIIYNHCQLQKYRKQAGAELGQAQVELEALYKVAVDDRSLRIWLKLKFNYYSGRVVG